LDEKGIAKAPEEGDWMRKGLDERRKVSLPDPDTAERMQTMKRKSEEEEERNDTDVIPGEEESERDIFVYDVEEVVAVFSAVRARLKASRKFLSVIITFFSFSISLISSSMFPSSSSTFLFF
jgi:hypothetical protein